MGISHAGNGSILDIQLESVKRLEGCRTIFTLNLDAGAAHAQSQCLYRCSGKRSACDPSSDTAFPFGSNLLPTILPLLFLIPFASIILSLIIFPLWLDQFNLLSHLITKPVEEAREELFGVLLPSLNHLKSVRFKPQQHVEHKARLETQSSDYVASPALVLLLLLPADIGRHVWLQKIEFGNELKHGIEHGRLHPAYGGHHGRVRAQGAQ